MLILDTCAFLWLTLDQTHLTQKAENAILKNTSQLFVSAISGFEIGLKVKHKKLRLPMPANKWFHQATKLHGIETIAITSDIAILSTQLSNIHKDPADRMIIATAKHYHYGIVTADQTIKKYPGIQVVW